MLTRFFVIVLLIVGIGIFVIEYTREDKVAEVADAIQPADVDENDVLSNGQWTAKGYEAAGTWRIIRSDGKVFVKLDDQFETRSAPDLKLFLSPKSLDDLDGNNATEDALLISPLQSNRGAQTYEIPSDADLANYESIIIHCQQFSKLWSGATLK